MKIYSFERENGKRIDAFDSQHLTMTRIMNGNSHYQVGCMHLEANGLVGLHQATVPQLLLVIQGEGVVKGEEGEEFRIKEGYAAYWNKGEWHETRTETGLMAIVIEGDSVEVGMRELEDLVWV